jgi:NADH:ubiquinone oxidoreductase subunit 6 (subunit J)
MAASRQWSDLSGRTRGLIIAGAVAELILKVAALIDIRRRPASQVRGPRWLWAALVTVVGSAGIIPVSYFVLGRRPPRSPDPVDEERSGDAASGGLPGPVRGRLP